MHATAAGKARRGPGQVSEEPAGLRGPKGTAVPIEGSFSFLCLHAAVALTPLLPKAHSLLLTSGTLSPVAPLVAELGLGTKPHRQPTLPHGSVPAEPSSITTHTVHTLSKLPQQLLQQLPQQLPQQQEQNGPDDPEGTHHKPGQKLSMPAGSWPGCVMPAQRATITTAALAKNSSRLSRGQSASQSADTVQRDKARPESNMGQTTGYPPSLGKRDHQQAQQQRVQQQQVQEQQIQHQQLQVKQQLEHQQVLQQSQQQQVQHQQVQHQQVQHQQVQHQQVQHQQHVEQHQVYEATRSQHARLHEGVELVSAPHHHTLPARLLPITISMAPGSDGQLVKLDSAYERRQDSGSCPGSSVLCCAVLCCAVPSLLSAGWLHLCLTAALSGCASVCKAPVCTVPGFMVALGQGITRPSRSLKLRRYSAVWSISIVHML